MVNQLGMISIINKQGSVLVELETGSKMRMMTEPQNIGFSLLENLSLK